MSKTYQIVKNNTTYNIIEINTGNIVFDTGCRTTAASVARRLNGGCGFRGWTPTFILQAAA